MRSKAKLVVLCVLGWAGSSAGNDVTSFEAALDKLVTDNNLVLSKYSAEPESGQF